MELCAGGGFLRVSLNPLTTAWDSVIMVRAGEQGELLSWSIFSTYLSGEEDYGHL
jgi:hypothetical protein